METTVNRKLYEGMFLVDSAQAADWDATKSVIEGILKRADAEITEMKKWDDRRLAYEVDGKSRGTYILCYFKADCDKIQDVEKAVQLSDHVMRVLILTTDQMTEEDMKRETPLVKAEREATGGEDKDAETADDEDAGTADDEDDFDTDDEELDEDDSDDEIEAVGSYESTPATDAEGGSDEVSDESETEKPLEQDAQ